MEGHDEVKVKDTMAKISLILGIIGLITSFIAIGIFFCIISFILGVTVLIKRKPGKGFAISGVLFSILGILLFIFMLSAAIEYTKTSAISKSQIHQEINTSIAETPETVPETTVPETTVPETTESADDFMASCQEIGYKSLLRTPDDYIGQRLVITAKVQQVMEGGLFDSSKYYRVQTDNDGYESYYDDEYFMYDFRTSDTTKLLKDDVLKIYAEFVGLEEVRRALTGTTEEVPAIKAYYVELISE